MNNHEKEKSSEVMLETVKIVYVEEFERFKQIEFKAQIASAINGVLIGAFIAYIREQSVIESQGHMFNSIYIYSFKILILLSLITSILLFLQSIKSETYHQVSMKNMVSFAEQNANEVMRHVAATYEEANEINKEKMEKKIKHFDRGMVLLQFSIVMFTIFIIVEELNKHF